MMAYKAKAKLRSVGKTVDTRGLVECLLVEHYKHVAQTHTAVITQESVRHWGVPGYLEVSMSLGVY